MDEYFWDIGNSELLRELIDECVVICFQISIFELLETTPRPMRGMAKISCDSLSNSTIGNSNIRSEEIERLVVIYFQISIFEPLETTLMQALVLSIGL